VNDLDFDPDAIVIPATDGVRIFENDLCGITIAQEGQKPGLVAFDVDVARRVADALLRIADRIEVERDASAEAREREILRERIRRAFAF
jgi:hypothetical protein